MKKRGRPREWVLDEEIIEVRELIFELKKQKPEMNLTEMRSMIESELEQENNKELARRIDRIWDLLKLLIPVPPRCVCGNKVYTYTFRRVEKKHEHRWEVYARCIDPNCRYLRKYSPKSKKWSGPESILKEMEKIPTFYQMDGQKVEG